MRGRRAAASGRSRCRAARRRPARTATARAGSCRPLRGGRERVERVFPGEHARVHVADVAGEVPRAEREQHDPDQRERQAPGGDVQQCEERAVEHQRGAELARQQQRRHRRPPHDQHRPELLHRRDRQPEHAPPRGHEDLAVVAQVAGEEDHDRDLRELRRLEGDAADVDVEVRAVDLLADAGQARQHRHADADQRDRVAVALEHAHAALAQREDRRREQHQPEHHPLRLLARERRFDAVDHHDPDAREHGHQREQVGVRVGQREADHEVRGQAQAEEQRAVGERHAGGVVERQVGRRRRRVVAVWMKIAVKPAVTSSAEGTRPRSSRLRGLSIRPSVPSTRRVRSGPAATLARERVARRGELDLRPDDLPRADTP